MSYSIKDRSFELVNCYSCGVDYLIPKVLNDAAMEQRSRKSIYCPNGHSWVYTGETEAEKMRRERDRLQQRLAQKDDDLAAKQRLVDAERRKIKKMEKRAAAGTCPCCQRSFSNMATHIKKQHPEFSRSAVTKLSVVK